MSTICPFCALEELPLVGQSDRVVAIRDGFPVSEGHPLVAVPEPRP